MRRIEIDIDGWVENLRNNLWHRDNGPAYMSYDDDYQSWLNNGKLHRLDGPAVINGSCQAWWVNDIKYDKYQYDLIINNLNNR